MKNKILVALIFILALANISFSAPALNRQFTFTASGRGASINVIGLGIGYYRITWGTTGGTTSACTVELDSSTDNAAWTGIPIAGKTCTSDGVATVTASGTANSYISVNLTAFTANGGSPTLTVNVLAYIDVATGTDGTGTSGYVAYFNSPTTLVGDSGLTYSGTGVSGILTLGTDVKFTRNGAGDLSISNATRATLRINAIAPTVGSDQAFAFASSADANGTRDLAINRISANAIGFSNTGNGTPTDNLVDLCASTSRCRSIYAGTSVNVGTATNTVGQVYIGGDVGQALYIDSAVAGNKGVLVFRQSRGTQASRSDSVNSDNLGSLIWNTFSGGTEFSLAQIQAVVDGTFTSGQRPPSRIEFYTNIANAVQTLNLKLTSQGTLVVSGANTSGTGISLSTTGKVYMAGITNANAQDYVCYNTATSEIEQNVTVCNLSSELYKHDIKNLDISGLDIVLKMQPVSFIYNAHPEIGALIGFTAQRTEPVDKRLVSYFKDGSLRGVDYMGYTAVLTKAIQELNAKVEALNAKIN